MKILCCIDALASGGAERQMVGLAIMLKDAGYEVKVMVTHHQPFYLPQLLEHNIAYEYLQAENKITRIFKVIRATRKNSPDIVIAYMERLGIMTNFAKLFGQRFKLIVSERNTNINYISFRDKIKFIIYKYSNFIICNSHTQTDFITRRYPYLSNKLKTIVNFTDLERFHPPSQEKNESDILDILVVARVAPQKNVLCFLDAIKLLVERSVSFKVSWFGHTQSKAYYQQCLSKVQDLNLREYISFYPPIERIEEEYRKVDLFCLPSLYEGTPNCVCEAMASGLPIVCSDICDNSRIVENGQNGFLFDPNSPEDIVSAVKKFAELSSKQKIEMGRKSRMLAEKKFLKDKFFRDYLALLDK